jgi:hypothetical protein
MRMEDYSFAWYWIHQLRITGGQCSMSLTNVSDSVTSAKSWNVGLHTILGLETRLLWNFSIHDLHIETDLVRKAPRKKYVRLRPEVFMSPPIAAQAYWQMGRRIPVMRPVADYLGVSYAPATLDVLITKQAPSGWDVHGLLWFRGIAHKYFKIHKISNNALSTSINSIMCSPKIRKWDLRSTITIKIWFPFHRIHRSLKWSAARWRSTRFGTSSAFSTKAPNFCRGPRQLQRKRAQCAFDICRIWRRPEIFWVSELSKCQKWLKYIEIQK